MPSDDGCRSAQVGGSTGPRGTVRTATVALLVLTAAVFAGCGALSGSDAPTDAAEADPDDAGGGTATPDRLSEKLSAPPETVFERVEEMLGAEAESYPEVEVRDMDESNVSSTFADVLVGQPEDPSALRSAQTGSYTGDSILIDEDAIADGDGSTVEHRLVYYFTVDLALQHGWFELPDRPHGLAVSRMSFKYVANAYAEEYRPDAVTQPPSRDDADVTDYEWARGAALDYYAYQWVTDRADSPVQVPDLLSAGDPPSSEHFLSDTDEEPLPMNVTLETSESWYRSDDQRYTTRGPVVTRAVLASGIDSETAAGATDGWGQDRYYAVKSLEGEDPGVVWAHRWDTTGDADEFEAAMAAHLAQRRNETDRYRFESRRLAPDVTLVVAGPSAFVNETTVAYDAGNLSVTVGSGE